MQLKFCFGQRTTALTTSPVELRLSLQNPLIAGSGEETWQLPSLDYAGADAYGIHRWQNEKGFCLAVIAPVTQPSIREISRSLYARLIEALGDQHFYRIWNFIPLINESYGTLDTYKLFCLGRAEALEALHDAALPAASAVGTPGSHLAIIAIGGTAQTRPVENPLQVPAWRYPEQYGPRSPSFARATSVDERELFVSGTASIRQSESLHDGDVLAQCTLTAENIDLVIRSASLPESDKVNPMTTSRVYLRHPADWSIIEQEVRRHLEPDEGSLNVIQAEVCRPELLVEAETHLRTRG